MLKKFLKKKNSIIKTINILKNNNIKYCIEGGLFLGAVRDNDFIEWDRDFEIALYYEQIKNKLEKILNVFSRKGFKINYVSDKKETFKINISLYDGIKVSLIAWYLEGKLRKRHSWQLPSYVFKNTKKINFLGKSMICPHHDYLKFAYGDWKKIVKSNIQKDYVNPNYMRKNYYLKMKFKIYSMLSHYFRFKSWLQNKLYGRENNFKFLIKTEVQKNSTFIDVGSNDGIESKYALDVSKDIQSIIFEPFKKNRDNIKKKLSLKIYKNRFKIYNNCLADKNSFINFYINKKNNNLNSTLPFKGATKIICKALKFDSIAKKLNLKTPIFIKADIEGGEEKLLKGAQNFLYKMKNIKILLELHPDSYKKGKFKSLISSLLKKGYYIKYVESAGYSIPKKFTKYKSKLIRVYNNRGLFKNIENKFVLENLLKNTYSLENNYKGFNSKIARSILLEKK